MKYTDAQIQKLLDGIFSGKITEYALPDSLYFAIADYLKKGVYEGFGKTLYEASGKDLELLAELRENIYMFSAAKTFQQVKEISGLLIDENGNLRSQKEFNALGAKSYDTWNNAWGKTEYNTAIGQAQQASKWTEVEKNKSFLPNLRYSAVVDPNTSDICLPLDGMVAPVDDPVWNTVAPLNHFNCRCVLEQVEEDTKPTEGNEERVKGVHEEMQDVFKMNSGKDGYIFKDDHPYFEVAPKDKAYAARNFDLPIPDAAKEAGQPIPGANVPDYDKNPLLKENVDKLIAGNGNFDTVQLFEKPGTGEFTADRLALHKQIIGDYIAPGSTKTGTSYFMGGAPATGKSSIINEGAVKLPKNILIIDADKVKTMLPEYNEMIQRKEVLAARKVHEESSILTKAIVKNALKNGYDLHLDGVGDGVGDGSYESVIKKVEAQRIAGKRVEAHYVTTSVETSLQRAAERAIKTGRDVPEDYIRDMHREISRLVPKLAENKVFDVLKLYDNDVPFGQKSTLIFEQSGGKTTILDAKKYNAFLQRGK
jgi:SPP1 gp7 family putative phage head morphogenesis protein